MKKSVIMHTFLILFATMPCLRAISIFGFTPSPCDDGKVYEEEAHLCYVCARGTHPIGEKCVGIRVLGQICSKNNAWLDRNFCLYCESGYSAINHRCIKNT